MDKWEIKMYTANITSGGIASMINPEYLMKKNKNDERTQWEIIEEFSSDGWELINVVPIAPYAGGSTTMLSFFFKRSKNQEIIQ